MTLERSLDDSDILIIAAPHKQYAAISADKPVVDVWNLLGNGTRI